MTEFFRETFEPKKETETNLFDLEGAVLELVEKMNDTARNRHLMKKLMEEEYSASDLEKMFDEIKAVIRGDFADSEKEFPEENREHLFAEHLEAGTEEAIIEMAKKALDNPELFIGNGSVAAIVESETNKNICLKIINNIVEYAESDNIEEEAKFQSMAAKLNVKGVRAPKPYYYTMSKKGHILVMENLSGFSLEQVMKGAKDLPEKFDRKKFFRLVRQFLKELHQKAGLVHLDIHKGNVMFDKETGLPYIIDFGKAKAVSASWQENPVYIDNTFQANDLKAVDELEKEFKEFLKSKEVKKK